MLRRTRKRQLGSSMERLEHRQLLAAAVAADSDGDQIETISFYDAAEGLFLLNDQNQPGLADRAVRFGPKASAMLPLLADWNGDSLASPGLYHQASGTFFISNTTTDAAATDAVFRFGPRLRNWLPLAGDWDGNGRDSVGLYDADNGRIYLRNTLTSGVADITVRFGPKSPGLQPLAGDWNNDGSDGVGLYDNISGRFYLDVDRDGGIADQVVRYGPKNKNWTPLTGDWNNSGQTTIALYDPDTNRVYLKNDLSAGVADQIFALSPFVDNATTLADMGMPQPSTILEADEVQALLDRASRASASEDAIIAIVDRGGKILGVRVEQGVADTITDDATLAFAIDGAVAKARTAAFFANDTAPLTSRLIRFVSQSTITQREVESNPNVLDENIRGPGFVAPIGSGGHFPPEIPHTPVVDLFAIEHTNRDSILHPGSDRTKGTADDISLPSRFNVPVEFIPPEQEIDPPESYGFVTDTFPDHQARGIATLPGGVPIFKDDPTDDQPLGLVGGIGVFFPGPDGFATHEQNFVAGIGQSELDRTNAPKVLEAEWIAFAAVGGSLDMPVAELNGTQPVANILLPLEMSNDARLTLVGIELEVIGPHPDGVWQVMAVGESVQSGATSSGSDVAVTPGGTQYLDGETVPSGWLVLPHDSPVDDISADDVRQIVEDAITEANRVRAAIRLPSGSRTKMVFAVADRGGNVLGLFRMPDATYFSIDVAVAKARNTAYYADPAALMNIDRIDGVPPGVAFTNRTFRFVAEPRFPDGVEGTQPSPFSILGERAGDGSLLYTRPESNKQRIVDFGAENQNQADPPDFADHTTVLGFDAFNPGSNFRDDENIANQNGIVFFPGSTPLYQGVELAGGFGVSGDGVDQDDVVTFFGAGDFLPPDEIIRADEVFVRGVRLPFIKFLRNPEG